MVLISWETLAVVSHGMTNRNKILNCLFKLRVNQEPPIMIADIENIYEEKPFEITGGSEILVTKNELLYF